MIAAAIFFLATFTILALVSSTLKNARVLRRMDVDAGMVAAQLFKTNRIAEGRDSGDFGDFYRDYYLVQRGVRSHDQRSLAGGHRR